MIYRSKSQTHGESLSDPARLASPPSQLLLSGLSLQQASEDPRRSEPPVCPMLSIRIGYSEVSSILDAKAPNSTKVLSRKLRCPTAWLIFPGKTGILLHGRTCGSIVAPFRSQKSSQAGACSSTLRA